MTTVTRMETVFIMNVNNRYLAMSGRTSDVGGKIFDTSRRNTTSERRMLMPEVEAMVILGFIKHKYYCQVGYGVFKIMSNFCRLHSTPSNHKIQQFP